MVEKMMAPYEEGSIETKLEAFVTPAVAKHDQKGGISMRAVGEALGGPQGYA